MSMSNSWKHWQLPASIYCSLCLPDNLYCVGGDVKPCSIQSNPVVCERTALRGEKHPGCVWSYSWAVECLAVSVLHRSVRWHCIICVLKCGSIKSLCYYRGYRAVLLRVWSLNLLYTVYKLTEVQSSGHRVDYIWWIHTTMTFCNCKSLFFIWEQRCLISDPLLDIWQLQPCIDVGHMINMDVDLLCMCAKTTGLGLDLESVA